MKTVTITFVLFSLYLVALYKTNAHGISKRANNDEELYVIAERDGGCVSVDSIEPCPVTWKLSPFAAQFYNQQTRLVDFILKGLDKSQASDECKNAMKTTLCGQAAPRCFSDGTQDFGDVAAACPKIYSDCPKDISRLFNVSKICNKVISGKIAKPKCVTPPKIEGNCPQPKYKMQTDALYMYERLSVDNTTNDSLEQLKATQQCVKDVDEVRCIAVYCSDDEKYLFTEHTKKYCQNVTKLCLLDPIRETIKSFPFLQTQLEPTLEMLGETCEGYPTAESAKQGLVPPTLGTPNPDATIPKLETPSPTGSANIQLVNCAVLLFSFIVGKLFT